LSEVVDPPTSRIGGRAFRPNSSRVSGPEFFSRVEDGTRRVKY
jgi:hypothetical protein